MQFMVEAVHYARHNSHFVGNLRPYAHQTRTLIHIREAIRRRETLCIENTSVTGSGKTLANFAAAILDGVSTCGIYPTNELMQDQAVSLDPYLKEQIGFLDSQGLEDIMAEQGHMHTHAQALSWATGTQILPAILTNPDVLYLALYNLYGRMFSTFAAAEGVRVFQHLLSNYQVFAFDEFHLYNAKQIANAAFIMGTMKELAPGKPHIFIFSSATPQQQFKTYARRLGMEPLQVTDEPVDDGSGCVVCEPLTVRFFPADLQRWQGGDAIRSRFDEIVSWADRQTSPARGVFIVDSVYEAKRLAEELRERGYPPEEIGEVHGYIAQQERAKALLCRFSVGTTTIDVGVNLTDKTSKDFLVCEARSAAQAIQRLGRLGRQGRGPEAILIPNTAWVVVPEYVYQYIQQHAQAGTTMSRAHLNTLLEQAYLASETFLAYTSKYSPLEAVAACERAEWMYLTDTVEGKREKMHRLVPLLHQRKEPENQEEAEKVYERYRRMQLAVWKKYGTEIKGAWGHNRSFLSDLESFRGGMESDFTVAIYDDLDERAGFQPTKIYTLPFVLRRTAGVELSEEQFTRLVKQRHPRKADEWLAPLQKQQRRLLGYIHVQELVKERAADIYFEIRASRIEHASYQVMRLQGFTIGGGALHLYRGAIGINETLKARLLNCWVSEQESIFLRDMKRLPPLFAVYPLRVRLPNGQHHTWSVAFGLDAFFLESIFRPPRRRTPRTSEPAIIL
jgi:CRISPR-associated helicase Cas3